MYAVRYDATPATRGAPTPTKTTVRHFDTEDDARRFARSLRSDVWERISAVEVYSGPQMIAASYDDRNPL